jgi:hypothetical protein
MYPKLSAANDVATVPSPSETAVGPPVPAAIPSATWPTDSGKPRQLEPVFTVANAWGPTVL